MATNLFGLSIEFWLVFVTITLAALTLIAAARTPRMVEIKQLKEADLEVYMEQQAKTAMSGLPGLRGMSRGKAALVYLAVDTVLFLISIFAAMTFGQREGVLAWILCMGPLIVWWCLAILALEDFMTQLEVKDGRHRPYLTILAFLVIGWATHFILPWWWGYYVRLFTETGFTAIILFPIAVWFVRKARAPRYMDEVARNFYQAI